MKRGTRILLGMAVIMTIAAPMGAFSGGAASAAPFFRPPVPYTCSGGDAQTGTFASIPSGTYVNITITGACQPAPGAVINVLGDINVAGNAVFDAQSFPSTINVGHDVTAAPGSFLGLGCLPDPSSTSTTGHPCVDASGNPTTGRSVITVYGNIFGWNVNTVLLNGITVKCNVAFVGGGGAIPWAIKTNTIGGSLLVSNVTPDWLGVIVNNIGGSVILANVHITDTDPNPAIFVASNTIGRDLACWGLTPAVSGGFGNEHNTVGGHSFGQCREPDRRIATGVVRDLVAPDPRGSRAASGDAPRRAGLQPRRLGARTTWRGLGPEMHVPIRPDGRTTGGGSVTCAHAPCPCCVLHLKDGHGTSDGTTPEERRRRRRAR